MWLPFRRLKLFWEMKINRCRVRTWYPLAIFKSSCKIALIVLNTASHCNCVPIHINQFWNHSVYKACTDGGVEILRKMKLRPDLLSGDFDSVSPDTLQYYRDQGITVISTPDQSATDFEKCATLVLQRIKRLPVKPDCLLVLGCLSGRFDHVMGCMSNLHTIAVQTRLPCYFIHKESLLTLLPQGRHDIHIDQSMVTGVCGLIPLGAPAQVTTRGFKWNLGKNNKETAKSKEKRN